MALYDKGTWYTDFIIINFIKVLCGKGEKYEFATEYSSDRST